MPEMKTSGSSTRRARIRRRFSAGLLCRPMARVLVHRDRELDAHLCVHLARRSALRVGQAAAAQADRGLVLGLGRDIELDLADLAGLRSYLAALQRNLDRHRYDASKFLA